MPKQTYSKGNEEAKLPGKIRSVMAGEMKPMLHIDEKDLPEVKNWKIGETYELSMKVKQVSMRDMGNGMCCEFEIVEIEPEEKD